MRGEIVSVELLRYGGKRIKALFTRQKTLDKNAVTDVSHAEKNFVAGKECNEIQKYPEAMKHGVKDEGNEFENVYYTKVCEKQHSACKLEEPGLLISKKPLGKEPA